MARKRAVTDIGVRLTQGASESIVQSRVQGGNRRSPKALSGYFPFFGAFLRVFQRFLTFL